MYSRKRVDKSVRLCTVNMLMHLLNSTAQQEALEENEQLIELFKVKKDLHFAPNETFLLMKSIPRGVVGAPMQYDGKDDKRRRDT